MYIIVARCKKCHAVWHTETPLVPVPNKTISLKKFKESCILTVENNKLYYLTRYAAVEDHKEKPKAVDCSCIKPYS